MLNRLIKKPKKYFYQIKPPCEKIPEPISKNFHKSITSEEIESIRFDSDGKLIEIRKRPPIFIKKTPEGEYEQLEWPNNSKKNKSKAIPNKTLEFPQFEKILDLVSFCLHKKFREEFLGDIRETRQDMQEKGFSKWSVSAISGFKICSVIWSAFRMRLSDLLDPEKENNN